MYGNFLSAEAVIRRILQDLEEPSNTLAAIVGTCAPNLIGKMILGTKSDSKERSYLEVLNQYLNDGRDSTIQSLRDLFVDCILSASSWFTAVSLAHAGCVSRHVVTCLATARNLHLVTELLAEDYVHKLIDSGVKVLLPTQYKAISAHKLIQLHDNALIALPTSTGKTLLGELCLVVSVQEKTWNNLLPCAICCARATNRRIVREASSE